MGKASATLSHTTDDTVTKLLMLIVVSTGPASRVGPVLSFGLQAAPFRLRMDLGGVALRLCLSPKLLRRQARRRRGRLRRRGELRKRCGSRGKRSRTTVVTLS